ncbi:MAG TPA: hypothetical protein VMO88_08430, partial [Acidimicrobiales bacterium]|nr:hypothetical protein [Acidimicrobiales bacterium]
MTDTESAFGSPQAVPPEPGWPGAEYRPEAGGLGREPPAVVGHLLAEILGCATGARGRRVVIWMRGVSVSGSDLHIPQRYDGI